MTRTLRLAAAAEAAALLGVSRQQVHRLARRGDFPVPVAILTVGRIWMLEDLEAWASEHVDRRPGRPETPKPQRP